MLVGDAAAVDGNVVVAYQIGQCLSVDYLVGRLSKGFSSCTPRQNPFTQASRSFSMEREWAKVNRVIAVQSNGHASF